jgi:arylsulfatase A-like enzyme
MWSRREAWALGHWLALCALMLGLRLWQTTQLQWSGPLALIDLWLRDLCVCVGLLLCMRAAASRALDVGIALVGPLAGLLHIMSYNYWRTHGGPLDGVLLRYALETLAQNAALFRSETPNWLILLTSLYLLGAPLVAWAFLSRRLERDAAPPRRARWLLGGLCVFAGVFAPPLSAQPAALSANPLVWLARTSRPPALPVASQLAPEVAQLIAARRKTWDNRLSPDTTPRHVFIVLMESTRASATTLHNPALDTTPHLAALAQRGFVVKQARAFIPHTAKSVVSILCGVRPYPGVADIEAWWPHMPAKCLPELLRERGYHTALFQSSSQLFADWVNLMYNSGFEELWPLERLPYKEKFESVNYYGLDEDVMLEPMRHWIRTHKGQPLHITTLTLTPHHDYKTPKSHKIISYRGDVELNQYLNAVRYADGFIGRFVSLLKEEGVYEESIIVLAGDHGEAFGEHGTRAHSTTPHEEALHVPLVIHAPWMRERVEVEGLRMLEDIVPTVSALLGSAPLEGYDGESLLVPSARAASIHACWQEGQCAARVERSGEKLIHHYGRRADERYRLDVDPMEQHSLELDAPHRAQFARLDQELAHLRAMYAALQMEGPAPPGAPAIKSALRFGNMLELEGYTMKPPPEALAPGDTVRITLRWRVLAAPGEGWTMTLRGPTRSYINYKEGLIPQRGARPSGTWRAGEVFEDRQLFHIPEQTRGELPLYVGWHHAAHGAAPVHSVETREGSALLTRVTLGVR